MGKKNHKKFNKKWSFKGNLIPDWKVKDLMNKIEAINKYELYIYINP